MYTNVASNKEVIYYENRMKHENTKKIMNVAEKLYRNTGNTKQEIKLKWWDGTKHRVKEKISTHYDHQRTFYFELHIYLKIFPKTEIARTRKMNLRVIS